MPSPYRKNKKKGTKKPKKTKIAETMSKNVDFSEIEGWITTKTPNLAEKREKDLEKWRNDVKMRRFGRMYGASSGYVGSERVQMPPDPKVRAEALFKAPKEPKPDPNQAFKKKKSNADVRALLEGDNEPKLLFAEDVEEVVENTDEWSGLDEWIDYNHDWNDE